MLGKHTVSLPFSSFLVKFIALEMTTVPLGYIQKLFTGKLLQLLVSLWPSAQKQREASTAYKMAEWFQVISDLAVSWCLGSKWTELVSDSPVISALSCVSAFAQSISSTQCNFLLFWVHLNPIHISFPDHISGCFLDPCTLGCPK